MSMMNRIVNYLKVIKGRLSNIKRATKQFFCYWKEFNLSLAFVQFKEILKGNRGYSDYFIKHASNYMIKELQPIIKKYCCLNSDNLQNQKTTDNKNKVWICWWQGFDNMPTIVKICYNRVVDFLETPIMKLF